MSTTLAQAVEQKLRAARRAQRRAGFDERPAARLMWRTVRWSLYAVEAPA
ncbi:hypothetical protein [Phytohabitans houttuyneae]|uniref:Uncharacterized protein n=1 Tax=Phytohabitans houttuyneae TaxID=1076126 RepID=A0A6V8KLU6_9ACTN|nr:hypothetical protein [Phytohabitans houttuyneae]GFJ81625.1 hypothetical protein Phou_058050 [Phytohabitans houttuyneae]